MPFDKIVILTRSGQPSDVNYDVLFRIDIPSGRERYYANPTASTQYLDEANPDDVSGLNKLMQAGAVIEVKEILQFPDKVSDQIIFDVARKRYDELIKLTVTTNVYDRYGSGYDGNTWTLRGVTK